MTVEGKLKRNRLFKDKFSDPHLKEKLHQEMKVGTDSPQIELSDEFMLALYKTLREDISEHEVEFLRISENDSMELLAKIHHYQNYDIQSLIDAEKSLEESLSRTKELRAQMDSKEVVDSNHYLVKKNELLLHLDTVRQQSFAEKDALSQAEIALQTAEKAYLEMHRPILFNELVLSDKLFEHCAEIDEAARNRMELIVRSLAKQYGVTEQLKAENQMEWVRQMNACKAQAEEVVKAELIYD